MSVNVKLSDSYVEAQGAFAKVSGSYVAATLFVIDAGAYVDVSGSGPPAFSPSLDFSDARNSQYLALVSVGGM